MSVPPISLVKSRENLQAICKSEKSLGSITGIAEGLQKYEQFDKVIRMLWHDIKQILNSYVPQPPKYVIKLHDRHRYNPDGFVYNQVNISELIEILKREYPGVDFTYKETTGYDGKVLESIIIMDWS